MLLFKCSEKGWRIPRHSYTLASAHQFITGTSGKQKRSGDGAGEPPGIQEAVKPSYFASSAIIAKKSNTSTGEGYRYLRSFRE
jgi:hypothetical protein